MPDKIDAHIGNPLKKANNLKEVKQMNGEGMEITKQSNKLANFMRKSKSRHN